MQIYLPHRRKHHSFQNNYSLEFDGVNEYVNIADNVAFTPSAITVSAWIYIFGGGVSYTILSKYNATVASEWVFTKNAANVIVFNVITEPTEANRLRAIGGTGLSNLTWYHVAAVWDGGLNSTNIRVYLNGVDDTFSQAEIGVFTGIPNTATPVRIASNLDTGVGAGFFWGHIDEVSFWNTGLNGAQISEIYNSGKPTNLLNHSANANLVSWWRMGDGATFPTIPDVKGGFNGTMTNMEAGDIQTDVP